MNSGRSASPSSPVAAVQRVGDQAFRELDVVVRLALVAARGLRRGDHLQQRPEEFARRGGARHGASRGRAAPAWRAPRARQPSSLISPLAPALTSERAAALAPAPARRAPAAAARGPCPSGRACQPACAAPCAPSSLRFASRPRDSRSSSVEPRAVLRRQRAPALADDEPACSSTAHGSALTRSAVDFGSLCASP